MASTPAPGTVSGPASLPLETADFDELEDILDELRTREEETPQWEFCEGFLAALVCCRRRIEPAEWLAALLGAASGAQDGAGESPDPGPFSGEAQRARFLELWLRREDEVRAALAIEIESLDDERAYHPEVMDARGALAALSPEERSEYDDEPMPAFAQVWALGFFYAVETWPDEWALPRDREVASYIEEAMQDIAALAEDDAEPPTISPFGDDGPPSVSEARLDAFGAALWAVYDLRELWGSLGPRVETVRKAPQPGRNDLCWCGSGKKFKKCHG